MKTYKGTTARHHWFSISGSKTKNSSNKKSKNNKLTNS